MGRVKRWLAGLLALVVVMAGVPMDGMEVRAAGYNSYDYELCPDGENVRIVDVASDIDGNIKIPSKIEGKNVVEIGDDAFSNCKSLTGVEIPNGVVNIGNSAFWGCSSLISIEIPNGVTNIDVGAFEGCSSLISIKIPNSVTNIDYSAFSGCSSLVNMEIPDSVKSIGSEAFLDCSSLERIEILGGLEEIGENAFSGCSNLMYVEIPDSVISVESGAFEGTKWLADRRIENPLVIESHILIDGSGCNSSVNIPAGVTCIADGAFKGCANLQKAKIPNSMKHIGESAFEDCGKLENIEIPDSVTTIGRNAFGGTKWLENKREENPLVIVNHILIDVAAFACGGIVEIPAGVKNIGEGAFEYQTLKSVMIPSSVVSIGDYAFYGCDLTNIIIPNGVINIGDYAFEECQRLTTIEIPDSVKKIGKYAFYNSGLTNVEIPCSVDDGAFYNCSNLISVSLKNGVENIGEWAFSDCENLTGIIFPNSVIQIGQKSFYNCSSITDVEIPSSVDSIGECAFLNCISLKNATISCSIDRAAFQRCSNLESVTMNTGVKCIGREAFQYCKGMTNVTIASGAVNIEENAFQGCISLAMIEIPESVVHFGGYTFMEPTATGSGNGVVFGDDYVFRDCGENLTICGYSGSEAEIYAKKHNIKFNSLGNAENHPKLELGKVLTISQAVGEEKKMLILCDEPGNYILRYENPANKDARVKFAIVESWKENGRDCQSTHMTYVKPFQSFTGSMETDNEANIPFEVKEGRTYEVAIECVEAGGLLGSYQLRCEKQPSVKSIQVDNTAYKVVAGGDNWWGLSGYAFLVTYTDNSVQHLFGPRGYHPETEGADPYLPYDDYGNSFCFALKNDNQETDFFNLVAGEYPVTVTVSDGQVFEDILKIWDSGSGIINGGGNGGTTSKINISQASITLSQSRYTYDGWAKKPSVIVELNGKTLSENKDYMVIYSNNINVGTAKVIIVGKGNYTGNKTVNFTIVKAAETAVKTPDKVSLKKLTVKSAKVRKGRKLIVKWEKDKTASGYQVQVSLNKNFKKVAKQKDVRKNTYTFARLKTGKKYYVRIRSYKKSGKETVYGAWSKAKRSGKVKK